MAQERPRQMKLNGECQYPFAAAPDIIRANQKDAYFQGHLVDNLSDVLRSTYGVRIAHKHASEARIVADLLYLCCTTLIGNRTLGEEYCDIVQVEGKTYMLPSVIKRAGYIVSSVIVPHLLNKGLPSLRVWLQDWLQKPLHSADQDIPSKPSLKVRKYLIENLSDITSPAPFYAIGLAIFYFSGAYYHISKRIWGLRYLFTKRVEPSDQRIGYEVLGVLLVLQLGVQAWLHVQHTYNSEYYSLTNRNSQDETATLLPGGIEIGLAPDQTQKESLEQPSTLTDKEVTEPSTTTPILVEPRYSLSESRLMTWIEGRQQRKCTLCLEELKDPSATTCGHVFCWICISDWIKEKAECPLCRHNILIQHVLPLRE